MKNIEQTWFCPASLFSRVNLKRVQRIGYKYSWTQSHVINTSQRICLEKNRKLGRAAINVCDTLKYLRHMRTISKIATPTLLSRINFVSLCRCFTSQSTIFQSCWDVSWADSVLSRGYMSCSRTQYNASREACTSDP